MKLSFDVPTFADVDKEFNHAISNYSGQSCEEFVPSGKAMYRTLLATCGSAEMEYSSISKRYLYL